MGTVFQYEAKYQVHERMMDGTDKKTRRQEGKRLRNKVGSQDGHSRKKWCRKT